MNARDAQKMFYQAIRFPTIKFTVPPSSVDGQTMNWDDDPIDINHFIEGLEKCKQKLDELIESLKPKFKTEIPMAIRTIDQAKKFLKELYENGESFHPEDDANDVAWKAARPTEGQCLMLNKLMGDIYRLKGFDPCEYLLSLNPDDSHD